MRHALFVGAKGETITYRTLVMAGLKTLPVLEEHLKAIRQIQPQVARQ